MQKTSQKKPSSHTSAKVAIVMPVYNTGRYLTECLDSLLKQSYKNFVVFCVNDGSTDESPQILDQYSKQDPRLVVIHKSNGGASSARNLALRAIKSDGSFDFVGFVDSDDSVTDDFIETFVSTLSEEGADYCVCSYKTYNTEKVTKSGIAKYGKTYLDNIRAIQHFCHVEQFENYPSNLCMTTRFFKTSLIGSEEFNESLKATEDQDFIIRVLIKSQKGVLIPNILYLYRQRSSSLSHSPTKSTVESSFLFAKLLLGNSSRDYPKEIRKALEFRVCTCWWQEARRAYLRGDAKERSIIKEFWLFVKQNCDISALPSKYKKRFFIFSCGEHVTNLYFKLFEKKAKIDRMFE